MKSIIKVGDSIRVAIDPPEYGWGQVSPHDIGIVTAVFDDNSCVINFEAYSCWNGYIPDLELAGNEEFSTMNTKDE